MSNEFSIPPSHSLPDIEMTELRLGKSLVLVSGGADSVYLFHLFLKWRVNHGVRIAVLHVNHGLRGAESDGDEKFVRALCRRHSVTCHVRRWRCIEGPGNLEDAARRFRLATAQKLAAIRGYTHAVTAHHRDDVVETLIMKAGRGAGIKGLSGIASRRTVTIGARKRLVWLRPLLMISKDDIITALQRGGMPWREDASNRDPKYLRNRVRHELVARMPSSRKALCANLARALGAVDAYLSARVKHLAGQWGARVPIDEWASWPDEIRFRYFARLLREKGFSKQVERRHFRRVAEAGPKGVNFGGAWLVRDGEAFRFLTAGEWRNVSSLSSRNLSASIDNLPVPRCHYRG